MSVESHFISNCETKSANEGRKKSIFLTTVLPTSLVQDVFRRGTILILFTVIATWNGGWNAAYGQKATNGDQSTTRAPKNSLRNAYFGDLHVHTSYSLDAYAYGTRNDPRSAYRYGRGEEVTLPGGIRSQLAEPLDFMAVTDHDIWLGEISLCFDQTDTAYSTHACEMLRSLREEPRGQRDAEICGSAVAENNKCFQRTNTMWRQIQLDADEFYEPGKFTTFSGFEWTATFKRLGMLHRNVIFRGGHLPDAIFSAIDLNNSPELLWQWLSKACIGDCQVLAIPHNTNFGAGAALDTKNSDGTPFTREGLSLRAKTEPLIEIIQVKGNSECFPGLGTTDEQCNFEQIFAPCKPGQKSFCALTQDYVRNALKTGLLVEREYGVNPFKYGLVGSTDTHSGAPGSTAENNWSGAHGLTDATPQKRLFERVDKDILIQSIALNPGGLAGVWAEENTRESIFDALKRKEAFATSGTRVRVRFFGGWKYSRRLHEQRDVIEQAYKLGVPMGGDLTSKPIGTSLPRFVVWATKDPHSANLQKIQIIKGWTEGGQTYERVYDVACSDNLKPDPRTHRCRDNGAKVDLGDCSYSKDKGATELSVTWVDQDFKPANPAFYYMRVFENPTCRWSTYDALRAKAELSGSVPPVIQERAWSSPIWYTPVSNSMKLW
jgi:hypothetical protein